MTKSILTKTNIFLIGEEQNMTETDAFPKREVFDPAEKYKMDHKRRGVALIFNHERFFWHLTLPERRGTSADRDNLKRRFSDLGFEVKCFNDLRAEELLLKIHEASTASHVDADCFLCVFLSHGEGNHIYAYDAKIEIQTLTGLFKGDKCQSLVGKPKIFIIQACRGNQHDVPVLPLDVVDHQTDKLDANLTQVDAASVYTLPAGADFLMCYSVAEGYYSHRETVNGSWYIQDLCEMLGKFGSSLEFTELLTLVNRKVSQRRVDFCKDPDAIGKKQIFLWTLQEFRSHSFYCPSLSFSLALYLKMPQTLNLSLGTSLGPGILLGAWDGSVSE
uniref:Caspase-6 n=2 Tax=Sus scrofa TaxID=9823 RepID=A0A8D1FPD1_PIG